MASYHSYRLYDHLCYDVLFIIYDYMVRRTTFEGVITLQWDYFGYLHQFNERPALIRSDGHCEYWSYGRLHRINGPAITYNPKFEVKDIASILGLSFCDRGYEKRVEYWVNGKLHNEDGPAIIVGNGMETFEYYSYEGKFERIMLTGTIKYFYQNGVLYRSGEKEHIPVIETTDTQVYTDGIYCSVEVLGSSGKWEMLEKSEELGESGWSTPQRRLVSSSA